MQGLPKIVRDGIPAMITKRGGKCTTRIASHTEARSMLITKLNEEAEEYRKSGDPDDLADILEVLHAIVARSEFEWSEIERRREAKHVERGGFDENIVLLAYTRS